MSRSKITGLVIGALLLLAVINSIVSPMFCPDAVEQANAITMEEVGKMAKDYETSKKQAKAFEEVSAAPFGSAKREEKLSAFIDLLEPDTQVYIRSLPRNEQLDAIAQKFKGKSDATAAENARRVRKQTLCNILCWWRSPIYLKA